MLHILRLSISVAMTRMCILNGTSFNLHLPKVFSIIPLPKEGVVTDFVIIQSFLSLIFWTRLLVGKCKSPLSIDTVNVLVSCSPLFNITMAS